MRCVRCGEDKLIGFTCPECGKWICIPCELFIKGRRNPATIQCSTCNLAVKIKEGDGDEGPMERESKISHRKVQSRRAVCLRMCTRGTPVPRSRIAVAGI